jgi:hypothetical protein
MMCQHLRQFIDSFWLIDIKVKDITESITERILRIGLHMSDQINQLCTAIVSCFAAQEVEHICAPLNEYG